MFRSHQEAGTPTDIILLALYLGSCHFPPPLPVDLTAADKQRMEASLSVVINVEKSLIAEMLVLPHCYERKGAQPVK